MFIWCVYILQNRNMSTAMEILSRVRIRGYDIYIYICICKASFGAGEAVPKLYIVYFSMCVQNIHHTGTLNCYVLGIPQIIELDAVTVESGDLR